jgi:hypothetical protein
MSQVKKTNNVTKSASFFIFCKAEDGKPLYIKDVRKWMSLIDELKLDDNVELEGSLFLALDIDEPGIERIHCGECDSQDFLVEVHNCVEETAKMKARWAEKKAEEDE